MTDLTPIIAQAQALTEPSREVDCMVAVALDGFFIRGERYGEPAYFYEDEDGGIVGPGGHGDQLVPAYTASVDAALALAERVTGHQPFLMTTFDEGWDVETYAPNEIGAILGHHASLAIAIVIATLEAKMGGGDGE